jgi:PBSX family phage portal protein
MEEQIINLRTRDIDEDDLAPDPFKDADPFMKGWSDLKVMTGISPNFKRKTSRIEKAIGTKDVPAGYRDSSGMIPQGHADAGSKAMNPGDTMRTAYGLFDVVTPPYNLYELANFYDTNFANHAAIDAKTANVVGLGYEFHPTRDVMIKMESVDDKEKTKKAKQKIERHKAEMIDWLENTNDEDSFTGVMEKIKIDLEATGNAYMEIGRTVTGDIGYIGHIPSTTMRVRRLRDGYVQIISNLVVYFRNFQATNPNPITNDPRPNEIIHFKSYSPINTFYGVPDIISAMSALIGDTMAEQYNIDYFENKAVPRYVITLKGAKFSADAEDTMFRFFQTNLRGQNHRSLFLPLPSDQDGNKVEFNMQAVENQVQEASFDKYRKTNRDQILTAHQVPLSKLGGTDIGGLAAALAQDRTFKEQVARPAQGRLEKQIARVIREKSDILELKFNEFTLTDETAQAAIDDIYLKDQVITPNEVRESLGKGPLPGGDKVFEQAPKQIASQKNDEKGTDERSIARATNATDSTSTPTGRNAKGEGRAVQGK